MVNILGVTGPAGSGKDTFVYYLKEYIDGDQCVQYALSDPLKQAASDVFGIPIDYFYDRSVKEKVIDYWGLSPRQMLQKLGTDACRKVFGEDVWLKRMEMEYSKYHNKNKFLFIVSDIRFDNEAEWVYSKGGMVVEVSRIDIRRSEHISEKGVNRRLVDHLIPNNGTLDDLKNTAHAFAEAYYQGGLVI